jgi:hypothetical protein
VVFLTPPPADTSGREVIVAARFGAGVAAGGSAEVGAAGASAVVGVAGGSPLPCCTFGSAWFSPFGAAGAGFAAPKLAASAPSIGSAFFVFFLAAMEGSGRIYKNCGVRQVHTCILSLSPVFTYLDIKVKYANGKVFKNLCNKVCGYTCRESFLVEYAILQVCR